jgi:DNA modification methylase
MPLKKNENLSKTTENRARPPRNRARSEERTRPDHPAQAAPVVLRSALKDLTQDSKNANRGTDRGNKMIEASLRDLGAGRSIVIDKHGNIIAGNKTAQNAAAAGLEDVIVVQTDGTKVVAVQRMDLDLSRDAKAKKLAIADNRTGQINLEWDPENLAELSKEIDLSGLFTESELGAVLAALDANTGATDDVPDLPKKAKTKPGALYRLGEHRLLCGDATKPDDIGRLMPMASADMVWTDPPYNVDYVGKTANSLKIQNDKMGDATFRTFLRDAFGAMAWATKPGAPFYVAHADVEAENFLAAIRESGLLFKQYLIWVKNAIVLGRKDYHFKHEPILYGWKDGASHTWYSDRKQTTVLEYDRPQRSAEHPTMKPVALVEYCIRNSSPKNGRVLDVFGGSGTTLMACESLGRRAFLMELDPLYCDVIVTRWENATGKKAVLDGSPA